MNRRFSSIQYIIHLKVLNNKIVQLTVQYMDLTKKYQNDNYLYIYMEWDDCNLFSHHLECDGGNTNTILFLFKKDGKKDQMSVINIGLKKFKTMDVS